MSPSAATRPATWQFYSSSLVDCLLASIKLLGKGAEGWAGHCKRASQRPAIRTALAYASMLLQGSPLRMLCLRIRPSLLLVVPAAAKLRGRSNTGRPHPVCWFGQVRSSCSCSTDLFILTL